MCSCPVVDASGLEQDPKADCIYGRLIDGDVLSDFMNRYFGLTEPIHSFLGELDLVWEIADLDYLESDGVNYLGATIPIGFPGSTEYYVKIIIDTDHLTEGSVSSIALTMLHEAAHAKLIAEVYDEIGSTDFDELYRYYHGFPSGNITIEQHTQMYNQYISDLAQGVKDFDFTQGVSRSIDFYEKAISFSLLRQVGVDTDIGENEFEILKDGNKNCN